MFQRISLIFSIIIALSLQCNAEVLSDSIPSDNLTYDYPDHMDEKGDTLLNVSNADRIEYSVTPVSITIVVNGLDDSKKNFYYYSKSARSYSKFAVGPKIGKEGSTTFGEGIKDIIVIEYPTYVNLSFYSSTDSEYNLRFPITDPYNRSVNCYTGTKNDEFGQQISVPLKKTSSISWDIISAGLYLGMITPTYASTDLHTRMGNSWELGWLQTIAVRMRHGNNSLSLGIGFGVRDIGTDKKFRFVKEEGSDLITLQPFNEEQTHRSSSISIFQLHVPLLYSLRFGYKRNCNISLGPVLNFNVSGRINTGYKVGENKYNITTSNLNQRPVTLDAYMKIGWQAINVYARFSPMKTLKTRSGLDFSTFSTGISIGF